MAIVSIENASASKRSRSSQFLRPQAIEKAVLLARAVEILSSALRPSKARQEATTLGP